MNFSPDDENFYMTSQTITKWYQPKTFGESQKNGKLEFDFMNFGRR